MKKAKIQQPELFDSNTLDSNISAVDVQDFNDTSDNIKTSSKKHSGRKHIKKS